MKYEPLLRLCITYLYHNLLDHKYILTLSEPLPKKQGLKHAECKKKRRDGENLLIIEYPKNLIHKQNGNKKMFKVR